MEQLLSWGGTGTYVTAINTTIPLLRGDFSLNIANTLSAGMFLQHGLDRITPTLDLNAQQIIQMANLLNLETNDSNSNFDPVLDIKNPDLEKMDENLDIKRDGKIDGNFLGSSKLECILHNHLPIFHTEHCVFARFLSTGNNYTNCGHPCETNTVSLRSMEGDDHLVLADQGCRNTVFNAQVQTGAEYVTEFLQSGIRHYRVELVDESPEYVEPLLTWYKNMLHITIHNDIKTAHSSTPTTTPTTTIATNSNRNNNKINDATNNNNRLKSFYKWLNTVPNSYGRAQGYTLGSLKPSAERDWNTMKPTSNAAN